MAHQADAIPWERLASNLGWTFEAKCCFGVTNFHPRTLDGQKESFVDFVHALSTRIRECAQKERLKFPEKYPVPSPEDVVISDEVAEKVNPTIETWRRERELHCKLYLWDESGLADCPDPADPGQLNKMLRNLKTWAYPGLKYRPTLPQDQRKMEAFLHGFTTHECNSTFGTNGPALFSMEVAKTLLMRGEMDTLLRICSHPEVDIRTWWNAPKCACLAISCFDPSEEISWRRMYTSALASYIVLNILSYFPSSLGRGSQYPAPEKDYRYSKAYQFMVIHATEHRWTADVTQIPHRLFFGLERGQLSPYAKMKDDTDGKAYSPEFPFTPKGFMPYDKLLNCQVEVKGYRPTVFDIAQVRSGLIKQKGIPPELANSILSAADYDVPKSQLRVPHHPFHPDNARELETYIEYCWAVLVRCDMVARELGMEINWTSDITRTLNASFNCYRGPKSLGEVVQGQRIGPGAGRDLLIQYQMAQGDDGDHEDE